MCKCENYIKNMKELQEKDSKLYDKRLEKLEDRQKESDDKFLKAINDFQNFITKENRRQDDKYDEKLALKVNKEEFAPIKKWVYGAIGSICFMFLGAVGSFIFITIK